MMIALDHLIVRVRDADQTVEFWTRILGLSHEGTDGSFHVVRVTDSLTLLFAARGTEGNEYFAFALTPDEFERAFERLRDAGIPYGDSFHDVGKLRGPGNQTGARGDGKAVYFFDPKRQLLEIGTYPSAS